MAWKSPAQTLQEWKEQRARERRSYDPLGAGPSSPFNMVRPEGPPGGFPAQQTQYDPLISMQGRLPPRLRDRPDLVNSAGIGSPTATSAQGAGLQATADMGAFPLIQRDAPGQQSTQGIADVFGAGPGYPFSGMFDQPSSMARPFKRQEAASSPAPLIAGPSISDRVRGGNRYTNMDPREREALNLTIAGELAPSSYNTPGGDQEVANMVETITTRAAQKGKSIEDTVKERQGRYGQYSPWNTLEDQADMRERFKEHAPDVRRMVSNAVTGEVMPTHEGLTSYHATRMPGTGRKPTWARGIEPAAVAGKHSFYTDIAPWSSSPAGPPLPAAPDFGGIASRDIPGAPPNTPFDPRAPMVGQAAAVSAGTDLPPPPGSIPASRSTIDQQVDANQRALGETPGQSPPIAPSPLTPEQVTAGQQKVNDILDPALEAAKNVPPAPAPMPGNPLGVDMMNPTPITMPGGDQTLAPMVAPPLIGSDRPASVQSEIVQPPLGLPGDYTLGSDRKLRPPSAGPPPLVAPAATAPSGAPLVTPRREVTPQTSVSPEPESNLPPPPPASVPDLPVTAAPEPAGMSTPAPLIAPTATTPINPRLSPKEIEKRARTRGFGTVENLTGDRWARGIGAAAGVAAGLATGNPLMAVTGGVQGYRRGDDIRRSYMNRTGPFGIFGNIFGRGDPRKKDKKEREQLGTPPSEPAGVREAAVAGAASQSGGLGSDRGYGGFGGYGGNPSYGGYISGQYGGYGGPLIAQGVGGAYRNR